MIIKRTAQKARKDYVCESCKKIINKGTIYHRLYGAAFSDDPKYEIMFHPECDSGGEIKK